MAVAALASKMTPDVGQSPVGLLPPLRDFMKKIKVEADENLLSDYPRTWPARVRVDAGSAQHERLVTHVPGDPARPFDRAHVRDKFLSFVAPLLGAQKAKDILARCSDVLATGEFSALVAAIEDVCRGPTTRTPRV
jgi:2-methylcitrate dehydratase PrpD